VDEVGVEEGVDGGESGLVELVDGVALVEGVDRVLVTAAA